LVAAREIPAKTQITPADLKLQDYNVDAKPPSALNKLDDAVGKITIAPMSIGEPVLPSKFSDPKNPAFVVIPASFVGADGNFVANTPNFRAMSITVGDNSAVAGTVQPGDSIDMMLTINFDPAKYYQKVTANQIPDYTAKIILERVPILARAGSVYTIRVDAATAERIAYIQGTGGGIVFLLRAPKDERASGTAGAQFSGFQNTFKIPIPEKLPAP
jgi:pilus assembly protein CpaB